jgi:hypothetical protein
VNNLPSVGPNIATTGTSKRRQRGGSRTESTLTITSSAETNAIDRASGNPAVEAIPRTGKRGAIRLGR